jgi:hypothetical protein
MRIESQAKKAIILLSWLLLLASSPLTFLQVFLIKIVTNEINI